MLEFSIDASIFASLLNLLRACLSKFVLKCTEGGMYIQCMEERSVALISVDLTAEYLQFYRCDVPCDLGIVIAPVLAIVGDASSGDTFTLKKIDDDETDHVLIELHKKDKGSSGNRHCEIQLDKSIVGDEALCLPDDQNYKATATLTSASLQSALSVTSRYSSQVTISCGPTNHLLMTTSSDADAVEVRLKPEPMTCLEAFSATFHHRCLLKFAKASCISNSATLCLSPSEPMCLKYPLPNQCKGPTFEHKTRSSISFYVAPFVEGDEDDEGELDETAPVDI